MEVDTSATEENGVIAPLIKCEQTESKVDEATSIYEVLLAYGVQDVQAKAKVSELYSPPRVTTHIKKFPSMNLVPGTTFDMKVNEQGEAWDFRRHDHRMAARRRIQEEKPYIVIGSPPCAD